MANREQIKKFIDVIAIQAQTEYKKRLVEGRCWVLPSVCIGQAAIETGWGTSEMMMKANAVFGIKWTKGCGYEAYSADTKEVFNGETVTVKGALFRAYISITESIADYYKLICDTDLYRTARNISEYDKAIQAIWKCGYATDPDYVKLVQDIIRQWNLTKYDESGKVDTTDKSLKYKEGDKVSYNKIYASSNSAMPLQPAITCGIITKVLEDRQHPYLINNGTGWIDDECITSEKEENTSVPIIKTAINIGDKVKVLNPIDYDTGKNFKLWYPEYDVIEVDGERVVIGIGKVVTSAIHVNYITKE